eukprot:4015973-Pyramimonas_sp.AAC.1
MPLPRSGHRRIPAARPGHDRRRRLRFGLDNITRKADAVLKAARGVSEKAWRGWAKQAFLGGA